MNIWDSKAKLAELELVREKHRLAGKQLTFDCINMQVKKGGEKVACKYGRIRSPSLLLILRGACYTPCIDCPYWEAEDKIYEGGE